MNVGEATSELIDLPSGKTTLSIPPSGEVWKFTTIAFSATNPGDTRTSPRNSSLTVGVDNGTTGVGIAESGSDGAPVVGGDPDTSSGGEGSRTLIVDGDKQNLLLQNSNSDEKMVFISAVRVS